MGQDLLARRNRELAILNRIAEALNRSVQLHEALQVVLELVAELFELRTGWVWLVRDGTPYLAASYHLPPALRDHPQTMEGSCYCLDGYFEGDLDGAANISVVTCSRLKGLIDGTAGLRYHASIPLYAHETYLGVFNVASADWRQLSEDDLRLLHTVGDLLSIAVERARLFEQSVALGAVEERNRLAREIHDTLAQSLTAVLLNLETADVLLEKGSPFATIQERIRRAVGLTRSSMEEVRRSVLDLRAAPLEGRHLPEALQHLAQLLNEQQPFELQVQIIGGAQPLPTRIEAGLYRIVQEALQNVCRHAQAQQVRLAYTALPTQVQIVIEDDGVGFDPEAEYRGHYGLVGLNERARLLGGFLTVHSAPGKGTRIEVQVPV